MERAEAANTKRIYVIRLRVGRPSSVVPEALRFAHEVVTEGTTAEGSTLETEEVPERCYCGHCEEEFECGKSMFVCPKCGAVSRDVRSGRELDPVNMEVS